MEEQPQRDDRLGRLAQAHLVGQEGGVPGHQERDPFQLVLERRKQQLDLPAGEQVFQGRLEQV